MKRLALLLVCVMGLSIGLYAQKELTISGGNCVSGMVCENSIVYTWGKNSTKVNGTTNYGLLGVGSTKDYESQPKEVTYFSSRDIYIQQVNCGSGSHFIALDCQGNVWCWGNNSLGQCGTGGTVQKQEGRIQAEPIQVSTAGGDLKNISAYNINGHLGNVDVVYAGNNNSFAILGDGPNKGCLVGWGGNDTGFDGQGYDNAYGQLGCGNTNNQAYPMFVLDGSTRQPLQGVVQVYAGDNSAYALVDPDGDGVGTIYSWGYQKGNGSLGRSATGGVGNTNDFNDPYARPVKKGDGTNLDNIKMLGCGDGVGYGLDVDGYIWAWGNGAWNNSAGVLDANYSWYSGNDTYATPLRVRKGLTTGASNDGEYLLAKWVAGGQGFGMAITADNKPVAWGGGGCGDGGGGATGSKIGQSADKVGAEYIVYGSGSVHNDVVLINRADLWGFYGRGNGDLYAWGCNDYGQLGIGGGSGTIGTNPVPESQTKATKINPPTNCNPRHPDPTVDLTPGDMTVCASAFAGQKLDAGFVVGMELADYYKITWYKDDVEVKSGSVKANGVTYTATEPGTYKVMIEHVTNGSGNGCVSYDPAVAEMTISAYPQNFTIPEMSYCGDSVEVHVSAANNSKAIYSWYYSKGSNATPVATTIGSGKTKISVADNYVTQNADGTKTIYVEETSSGIGTFIPSSFTNFNGTQSADQYNNFSNPGFTVQQKVTLQDFKVKVKSSMQSYYVQSGSTATLAGSVTLKVNLCNAKTENGHLVANTASVVKSFSGTLTMSKEITTAGTYDFTETLTIDAGNYTLNPGTYFLVYSTASKTGDADLNKTTIYYGQRGLVNVTDTYTGDYIVGIGASQGTNFKTDQTGMFFDINFATPQGFCDRIKIDLPENCPCDAPADFTIKCTDASLFTNDSIFICANNAQCTLTTGNWAQSSSSQFAYIWYKDDAVAQAATNGYTSSAFSVTDAGTYKIMVYDKNAPTVKTCQKTQEVIVLLNPVPTVKVTGGGEFCEGEEDSFTSPVTFTMTGEPKFRVYWDYTDNTGTTKTKNKRSTAYTVEADVPTAVGVHTYTVKSVNDDGNCKNENVSGTATITVKPKPSATITVDPTSATVCEGSGSVKLTATSDPTGAAFAWEKDGSTNGSGSEKTLTAPAESGVYSVKATLDGCTGAAVTQEVTINPKPEIKTLTADKDAVCSGGTINLSATVSDDGDGTFTWSGDGVTGNGATATVSNDVTTDTEVTITLNYTSAKTCEAEAKTIKVTFYAYPDAPTVKDQAYCVDDTPKQLEATPMSGATLNWYGNDETGGTASSVAPTPSTAVATNPAIYYYVSQTINGCESKTRAKATVIVDDTLSPVITADPGFEVCENTPINLNVDGTFQSTTWSGSGAAKLDATTIQTPTFNATEGTYSVRVQVEDMKGCKGSAEKTITVNPTPVVELSTLTNECLSSETAQTLKAIVTPSGTNGTGTWTGDVTKVDEFKASYTPSVAGVGTHEITYDFESDKHCVAKQVKTSVEVFKMPTPTISVSNNSVCVSGNNSDVVTIQTTGTEATGTLFVYSVSNGGSVDVSTGAFDPTANAANDYTITLNYTDANGCKGSASADLTVHALPVVEITSANPTELCYNGAAIDVATNVSPAGGTGVWTGTESSSSSVFDPKVKTVGANAISYTYTDIYKCQNSDDFSIEVKKPAVPTPGDDVNAMINNGNLAGIVPMTATMNTPADKLQWWYPEAGNTIISETTSYESPETTVGSYHYLVRSMLTVNGGGCYSDSVMVTTNISACNAMAPRASDIYVCVGTQLKEFSATQTSTLTNQKISWLTDNPVGKNGTEADSWILQDASTTFTPAASSVNLTTAGEYVYYAAEYDGQENCWSAGTKVTLHVVDNPIVTISSPENICAKGTEAVPVTVSPQNGNLSANVGTLNGFQWLPGDYSGDSEKVTFTYTVISDPYADGTTCQTIVEDETTAHFMEAPTGSTTNWLIGNIDGITTGLLTGTRTSTGQTITWYDTQTKNTMLQAAGDSYTPDKTALQAEVGSADTYVKSYWITQTDGHSCESTPTEVILNLIDCPWEAPEVSGDKKCHGFDLDPLKGTQGASVATQSSGGVTKWNWYDENKSLITSTASSEYAHGVSKTTDGTTTFWVSYSANEKNSGNECESPMTKVTVTVLPLPTVTFDKQSEIVCYTTEETKINVNPASENGAGSGVWSITGDPSAISANGIFYAKANGDNAGQKQYTITYTYTDAEECEFSNSRTIDVIYLPAPETKDFYAMTSQSNPVQVKVTSAMTENAEAKWFESATLVNDEKGTGTTWATGDATNLTVDKNYYARQYKEGCYSESTVANVKIVPCPIPSVEIEDEAACNYEEIPTLIASTGGWTERDGSQSSFKFYTSETTQSYEKIVASGEYKPTLPLDGTLTRADEYKYYVSEYNAEPLQNLTTNEGCEGPRKAVKITISGTSAPTIVATGESAVCEGTENPSFVAQYLGTISWFEEDPGEVGVPQAPVVGTDKTFTPNGSDAGDYTIWAVMKVNDCYGPKASAPYTIKPIPDAPLTEGAVLCYEDAALPVKATPVSDGKINWYADAQKITSLSSGQSTYQSKEIYPGEYTYYASQVVKDCESNTNSVVYRIKSRPSVPVVTPQRNLCEYDEAPLLEANGENVKWYSSSDKSSMLSQGETYQVTDTEPGTKRYYASQTVEECEGDVVMLSYVVNAKPANPMVTGANVCEGNEQLPSLGTNMPTDKWYADETGSSFLTTGYTYTPEASEVGNSDKTYYVQREINGCVSDMMPVVLHIVPKPTLMISNDTTLCIYDSVVPIQAFKFYPTMNDASSIEWQVKSGKTTKYFDDEAEHQIVPVSVINAEGDYKVSATYKYVYEGIYCMSDTASMTYSVKGQPRKPIVFSSVICQGEDIKDLQALGSPNMMWGSLDGAKPFAATGTKYHFDPGQVLDTGTYSFMVYDVYIYDKENNLGCRSDIDTVYMTVAPAAKTKLYGRDSVCVGATEQYYTQYTKESTYFWNVTGSHLNYSKDAMSSSVRYVDWMKSGVDTLTVYEQTWAGCEGWDTLVVRIAAKPKALYTWEMPGASNLIELTDSTVQDTLWYTNEEGELKADPVPYKLYWNYGHIGEDENAIDTVIAYEQRNFPLLEGNYIYGYNCPILTVENSFGCKDVYKECIFVNITSSIYVPTAFAPMNPAHSVRTFQPKGYNLKTCEISVFDKWGNLLWHSDAVKDGMFVGSWDGRYEGKMLKSDVYIWKMEATFLDGQVWEGFDVGHGKKAKFGSVTLVR